ncbi:galactosyltransferase-related protein [Acinetobacter sp. NIPH 1869]|uniref:galactosyltransferase-related protein n=1 Tax=Acinetobacter higginsii TaxID=70347 RepID=UPI001F4BBD11|nr:galactosyltransferase-related protein [Acinetobacter higginsii]MCH7304936.1 galactosyltransferase-related protein [Acinetobacter higginsii]
MLKFFFSKKKRPDYDWVDLSIVIPIDLSYRSHDILQRIKRLVTIAQDQSIGFILGCNAQPEHQVQQLKKIIAGCPQITLVIDHSSSGHLSHLRNIALAQVQTRYVMFLDIDIHINLEQIHNAFTDVQQHPAQLCMYPCLYLSKKGSKQVNRLTLAEFRHAYYDFRRDFILHLAFPSSIIITDLKSVHAIEGFDEQFIGHGYEDFDFMLRLFQHKGLIDYQPALLLDETYLAPMMATGFRAILAESQLEQLLKKQYFLHIHHEKDKKSLYHQQRQANQQRFEMKLKQQINAAAKVTDTAPPYLLKAFFQLLAQQKIKRPEYSTLWAEIQGYKLRKL